MYLRKMTPALRLTALSCAIGPVYGRWFPTGRDAVNWGPATRTAAIAEFDPAESTPTPTPAPGVQPLNADLRKRDESKASTCGFPVDDLSSPAVSCEDQSYCMLDRRDGIVGCCTEQNPRNCNIPTSCLESTASQQWSGDPQTTYCGDTARPHCITYFYDANFYDVLYGASFLACASEGGSGTIATTPAPGWQDPGGNTSTTLDSNGGPLPPSTAGTSTIVATITVFPGDDPSSSATPTGSASGSSRHKNIGAIVGGTVGGVAGLALIVVAILFLLYRRRRRNREPSAPVEHDYPHAGMVYEQAAPGSQYASTFYGEAPPGMVQTADQNFFGHPHDGYGTSTAMFARDDHSSGSPSFFIPGANPVTGLRPGPGPGPSKQQDDLVSPIEPSPVSHVSPSAQYNTMVSAITNLTPPPPQSDYSQFSPPPPQHYQSYRPYPGT